MMGRHFLVALAWLAAAGLLMGLLARELSRAWFLPGLQPELVQALEQSLDDQRELARLKPETADERRRRFDRTQTFVRRLRVLALSREGLARRHAGLLLTGAVAIAALAGGAHAWRQSRRDRRLGALHGALRRLAEGAPDVRVNDRGRDVVGRVARIVEQVSAHYTRDRRRLASLEDLSRWQEAARRHAHEMRTPLAAARLDLDGLREAADDVHDEAAQARLQARVGHLDADLRRLAEFAGAFAAFGRLPPPQLTVQDLAAFVREYADRFSAAWPELEITASCPANGCPASIDGELLRQVLVNLCENSARSLRDASRDRGRLHIALDAVPRGWRVDVADDGPGIAPAAQDRLFQPYATFRAGGTGLGLAISRKVLLDHGGDLEWVPTETGATFRLLLPGAERAT